MAIALRASLAALGLTISLAILATPTSSAQPRATGKVSKAHSMSALTSTALSLPNLAVLHPYLGSAIPDAGARASASAISTFLASCSPANSYTVTYHRPTLELLPGGWLNIYGESRDTHSAHSDLVCRVTDVSKTATCQTDEVFSGLRTTLFDPPGGLHDGRLLVEEVKGDGERVLVVLERLRQGPK